MKFFSYLALSCALLFCAQSAMADCDNYGYVEVCSDITFDGTCYNLEWAYIIFGQVVASGSSPVYCPAPPAPEPTPLPEGPRRDEE
jgi:hypothetical protein